MNEQPVDNRRGRHEQPASQHQRKSPQSFGRTRPTWDGPTTNLGTYDPAATLVMEKIRPDWANEITAAFNTTANDTNRTTFPLNTERKALPPSGESKDERKPLTPGELMEAGLNGASAANATPQNIEHLRHAPEHSKQPIQDLDEIMFTIGVDLVRLGRNKDQVMEVLHLLASNPLLIRDVSDAISSATSGNDFHQRLYEIHKKKYG